MQNSQTANTSSSMNKSQVWNCSKNINILNYFNRIHASESMETFCGRTADLEKDFFS